MCLKILQFCIGRVLKLMVSLSLKIHSFSSVNGFGFIDYEMGVPLMGLKESEMRKVLI
jgi:hypothetical protein